MKKTIIKAGYFILLPIILLFLFFPTNGTFAYLLPNAPGLGDACTPDPSTNGGCPAQLFCSEASNKCVECDSNDQCGNDTCSSGVCVAPGGNSEGGSCISDSQCKSGLKCGNDKQCFNPANETDSPTPIPSGSGLTEPPSVDLTIQGVFNIITGLACWLLRVISAILVIFIILAGLKFMAAQSNPTKFTGAVTNFRNVLIGTLVILGVYVIIATIANAVGLTNFSFIPLVC